MRPQQSVAPGRVAPGYANHERAASAVEYGLLVAVLMVALLLALEGFSGEANDDLLERGSHVGNPQGLTPTS